MNKPVRAVTGKNTPTSAKLRALPAFPGMVCQLIDGQEIRVVNRPTTKVPGYNVDRLDITAGLRELTACGYDEPKTVMVIEYALARWARGEEKAAQRGAIDRSFHGINLTSWMRVLAAARAHAATAHEKSSPSQGQARRTNAASKKSSQGQARRRG